ncbi:MAG: hypothetical protein HUK02_00735 [Bacteroidaceae bacterium]|nr:hypothetical protein [Bacteroidaceae bacterium]
MNQKSFLLPYRCQQAGWWLLGLSLAGFVIFLEFMAGSLDTILQQMPEWMQEPLVWTFYGLPLVALLLICLSREKDEDEYITHLRGRAVFWVVVVGFIAALFSHLFVIVGGRLYPISTVSRFLGYAFYFKSPVVLSIVFLLIFKGTIVVNRITTRHHG